MKKNTGYTPYTPEELRKILKASFSNFISKNPSNLCSEDIDKFFYDLDTYNKSKLIKKEK